MHLSAVHISDICTPNKPNRFTSSKIIIQPISMSKTYCYNVKIIIQPISMSKTYCYNVMTVSYSYIVHYSRSVQMSDLD